jgi:hypothetical protein
LTSEQVTGIISESLTTFIGISTLLLPGILTYHASLVLLKTVSILSLLVGTYTTNKDMFIFFKSIAAERMRVLWLESFRKRHEDLKKRVVAQTSGGQRDDLIRTWNAGCPQNLVSTHEAFTSEGQKHLVRVWDEFIAGRSGTAIWLLDVPRIANWEKKVEESLNGTEAALSEDAGAKTLPGESGVSQGSV